MEPDRYQYAQRHYLVGMLSLLLSLTLFAFSAYLIPYLFFGWHYHLPAFIQEWLQLLTAEYEITRKAAVWVVFLTFLTPAILFSLVSKWLSCYIERKIDGVYRVPFLDEPTPGPSQKPFVLKLLLMIVLVFVAARFFQWLISSPFDGYV